MTNGPIQHITVEESTSIQWVNRIPVYLKKHKNAAWCTFKMHDIFKVDVLGGRDGGTIKKRDFEKKCTKFKGSISFHPASHGL